MGWKQDQIRQVRRSANIIGGVELACIALNFLLYPIMWLMPVFPAGSLAAELSDLILYVIVFALPFSAAARLSDLSAADLVGKGKPSASVYVMTIGLTLGWSFVAGWMGTGLGGIMGRFGVAEISDAYVLPESTAALVVQFISVAVVPPIVEEMCYRGFFLHTAVRSMGTWGAIVVTALTFWMAHYSIEILPLAFGFGVLGGYIRRRYGSLLPSMCGHFAVNGVYMLINVSWEIGGLYTGTAVAIAVDLAEILLGAVGVALFVRKGCLREILDGSFGYRTGVTPGQIARGVLTSIPALLLLLITIYFTAGNLEAF